MTKNSLDSTPSAPPPAPLRVGAMAVLLGILSVILYWPATRHDFINYDDGPYVTQNRHVQTGFTPANLKWVFTTPVTGNWHPLTMLSHALDCQLFGLDPSGHHLTSILLHGVNTALVFLLLNMLAGSLWRGAFVAALFGLHPVNVECVAWVAERKSVLSLGFGLLSLLFYVCCARGSKWKTDAGAVPPHASCFMLHASFSYWLSLGFLLLGLMSKPSLVTWPCLMLLLDYWPLNRFAAGAWRNLIWEKAPFFAAAAVLSVVTFVAHRAAGDVVTLGNLPPGERVGNAVISCCRYLGMLFWPDKLCILYIHSGYWPLGQVLVAVVFLAGVSALFWIWRGRRPWLLMGWLWFLGTLAPMIGLVQVGEQALADRHAYIPELGIFTLLAWGVADSTRLLRCRAAVVGVPAIVVLAVCFAGTRQELAHWRNSETVFRRALTISPDSSTVHDRLGSFLAKEGRVDEAIPLLQEAVRLSPDQPEPRNNLAAVLMQKGRFDDAIEQLQAAQRLDPGNDQTHYNLGLAYFRKGKMAEAIREGQAALALAPNDPETHNQLGLEFAAAGNIAEATNHYATALRIKPDFGQARYNFGTLLLNQGDVDGAISQLQAAVRLLPNYARAHNNLAIALLKKGELDPAIGEFQEAARLDPNDAQIRAALARVLSLKNPPASR